MGEANRGYSTGQTEKSPYPVQHIPMSHAPPPYPVQNVPMGNEYMAPPPGSYGAPPPGSYVAPPPGSYVAPPPGSYVAPPPCSNVVFNPNVNMDDAPPSYTKLAMVTRFVCCYCFGAGAILYSLKSTEQAQMGNFAEAEKLGKKSLRLSIAGIVFGVVFIAAVIFFALWRLDVIKF